MNKPLTLDYPDNPEGNSQLRERISHVLPNLRKAAYDRRLKSRELSIDLVYASRYLEAAYVINPFFASARADMLRYIDSCITLMLRVMQATEDEFLCRDIYYIASEMQTIRLRVSGIDILEICGRGPITGS